MDKKIEHPICPYCKKEMYISPVYEAVPDEENMYSIQKSYSWFCHCSYTDMEKHAEE